MEISGPALRPFLVGNLGLAVSSVLSLLDAPLGVIELTGAWWYAWLTGMVAMAAGFGVAFLLASRDDTSDPG